MIADTRVGSFVMLVVAVIAMMGVCLQRPVVAAAAPIALDLTYGTEAEEIAFSTMTDGELAAVMDAWCERERKRTPGVRIC